jgi:hypothetical protein
MGHACRRQSPRPRVERITADADRLVISSSCPTAPAVRLDAVLDAEEPSPAVPHVDTRLPRTERQNFMHCRNVKWPNM